MVILKRGSRGPEVANLKLALKIKGFSPDSATDEFDGSTEVQVKLFQATNGLTIDGVVGPITMAKIKDMPPVVPSPLVKGTNPWYADQFEHMKFDPGFEAAILSDTKLVLKHEDRYRAVEALTGVKWWVIGGTHFKEASCDSMCVPHNGQRIVGTGMKTSIVPIGCGPFATWEDAAVDALKERWAKNKDWSLPNCMRLGELYNGPAYLPGHAHPEENSPYIWARTSVNDGHGIYVRDHVFDPEAPTDKTSGLAALWKQMQMLGKI